MAGNTSIKRVQINKANTTMVIATAIAAFLVTFSVVAGRALLSKQAYQGRVIHAKETAVKQLQSNIAATSTLANSYKAFVSTPSNVLGGNPTGSADNDGDNAKIILDALPSQYDFPALTSSLEKVLANNNFKLVSITGSDDELAQLQNQSSSNPQPVEMPFQFSVTTDIAGTKSLLQLLERSIRPIKVQAVEVSGNNSQLTVNVTAVTYYQPQKSLNTETKVVQ